MPATDTSSMSSQSLFCARHLSSMWVSIASHTCRVILSWLHARNATHPIYKTAQAA